MTTLADLTEAVIQKKKDYNGNRLFTVAISGIDASGKGHISRLLQQELEVRGYKTANINIDPWQNPIPVRLQKHNPAANVYKNIFRWDDFFEQLIFPLQKNKCLYLKTAGIHSHADEYYPLVYDYQGPDILLVEGILLFKRKYLVHYDYKIWIDCSFKTGMKRALYRNVERLDESKLVDDYNTFYYPAQKLHLEQDNPRKTADIVFNNDPDEIPV